MEHSIRTWDMKRTFFSLPDLWFLLLLLLGWVDYIGGLFVGALHAVNIILGGALLILTALLIKQLFYRKVLVSFVMGWIFLLASLYFSFALISELAEFASLAEQKAVEMMIGGGLIVGGSMVMSVLMMIRNTLK